MSGRGFLVAGPGNGSGRAIAFAAATRGEHVVLCERPGSEPSAAAIVAEADAAGASGRLSALRADASREDAVEQLVEQALDRLPGLDALVVLAEASPPTPLDELSLASWSQSVSVPLREACLLTRAAVGEFLASGKGGRIVLVSPPVRESSRSRACAMTLQSALRSFGRSVGKEYGGREIACNIVWPCSDPGAPEGRTAAETVLFLASEAASYVNGACVRVATATPSRTPHPQ